MPKRLRNAFLGLPGAYLLAAVICALSIATVWMPVVVNHYVGQPEAISPSSLARARNEPEAAVLDEFAIYRFGSPSLVGAPMKDVTPTDLIYHADNFIRGAVTWPNAPVARIAMPFLPDDLDQGHSSWQLFLGSLGVVDVLNTAHEHSRDVKYMKAASEYLVSWYKYERSAYLPNGFLFNDHAIAARIGVTIRFWRHYRQSAIYEQASAEKIVNLVSLWGKRLSNPLQFTYKTNHGVMQNLSLMRIATAFPTISDRTVFWETGYARFMDQMAFFINSEGVVLEHSAEYHVFGINLIGEALRHMTLNGVRIPASLSARYNKGLRFARMLCHPGTLTLPRVGDTKDIDECSGLYEGEIADGAIGPLAVGDRIPSKTSLEIFPAAGYAVAKSELNISEQQVPAQTVFNWSYHPGHGHKHADELSLHLWAGGHRWFTAVGYYPYIHAGREEGTSWTGSNAPHFQGETADIERNNTLRGSVVGDGLLFLDAERRNADGTVINRQLVRLNNTWAVLDSFHHATGKQAEVIWPFEIGTRLEQCSSADGSFTLTRPDSPYQITLSFTNSVASLPTRPATASRGAIGRVESGGQLVPVEVLQWTFPADGTWALAAAAIAITDDATRNSAEMLSWRDAEHWQMRLRSNQAEHIIERDGYLIVVDSNHFPIKAWTGPLDALHESRAGFSSAKAKYATANQKDYIKYRKKVSIAILATFGLYSLAFAGTLAFGYRRMAIAASGASMAFWIFFSMWLHGHYFIS